MNALIITFNSKRNFFFDAHKKVCSGYEFTTLIKFILKNTVKYLCKFRNNLVVPFRTIIQKKKKIPLDMEEEIRVESKVILNPGYNTI